MNTAVVGLGRQGTKHLNTLLNLPEVNITGVCDSNKRASDTPLPFFTDYKQVLSARPDAVVVAVPNGHHQQIASFFIENGVHVIKEKPLALSYQDGVDLVKLAKANKRTLFTLQQRYYSPLFQSAREQVDKLGKLKEFFYSFTLEDNKQTWYWDKVSGGGSWINMGWHGINMLQWLLGPIDDVVAVHNVGGKRSWEYQTDHSSFARVSIDGVVGCVFFSCVHPKEEYFRAEFEQGTIYLTRNSLRVVCGSQTTFKEFNYSDDLLYNRLHKTWIKAVLGGDYDNSLDLSTLSVIDRGLYASN